MPTATMTSKGQITIPLEVRKALGLKPGVRIDFFEVTDGEYALRAKSGSIMAMRGCVPKKEVTPTIEAMDQAILDHAALLDQAALRGDSLPEGEAA